jgi:leucyl-tRNA synthetase
MEWTDEGIGGRVKFLDRVWRAAEPLAGSARSVALDAPPEMRGEAQAGIVRALHAALKSGSEETETRRFHYNTTLARLDELVNAITKFAQTPDAARDPALIYGVHALPVVLAPFAPHIAEELWALYGYETSVHLATWIDYDPAALALETVELVVQVNGKIRGRLAAAPDISEADALALAVADENVRSYLGDKPIRKQIFVPGKLISFVTAG